ncbi:PAS domain S-box-containing protein [Pedobacter sp. CG_S7]|uniref:PAS domain S-box protein n=1 Tax=Pedobacter sp. CG_S7 TaxID=3143930 RepID=UPI003397EAE1
MSDKKELVDKFDNLCKLAALICMVPRAILVLKEEGQMRLKASFGIGGNSSEDLRDYSFSEAVFNQDGFFQIADTLQDDLFKQHLNVLGKPFIRFYAGAPLLDKQGNKVGAICVSGDQPQYLNAEQKEAILTLAEEVITHLALKKNERELHLQMEQFEELRSLSAISSEIHCILDYSGKVLFINDAVFQLLGYSVSEALGMKIWEVCHKDDLEMVVNFLQDGLKHQKKNFQLDFRVIGKSGIIRLISWSMVIKNERWYTYGRDITESKRVETELLKLSFVASKVNNAIVINDANNHVTWVNAAFEKITGFTLEDLKGRRLGDLISGPKTDVSLIEHARELNRQNQSFTLDILAYRKDKKPIWVSVYNTIVFDEAGKVSAEVEIIIDITDKKLAEQEMLEAKEQALQLSEAKEMFLSVMSHEIRTPLNAILGMTHLLLENDPKPSQMDDLHILKFSGDNLLNIVNDILDFTKMETGNLQLEAIPFSLRMLVNDILNSLQVNVSKKQNTLKLSFGEGIPERLLGDKTRLYQILMNLLGNAIKFTQNGLIELFVTLDVEREQNVVLFFEIKDSGIGIPADKQQYIFESFTQAKSDISRKYGGTGLGLAITKKLLQLYGSEIVVESSEGKGSAFSFHIAFDKIPVSIDANAAAEEIPEVFHHKRILVVDDNEINVLIAKRILNKWGLLTEVAYSGTEAIAKVKNGLFDLVFMDVKMPDMDGFEATSIIRKLEGDYFKTLPIIALTASSLDDEAVKFKESGMNGHLLKPLNPPDFKRLILEFLTV